MDQPYSPLPLEGLADPDFALHGFGATNFGHEPNDSASSRFASSVKN